MNNDYYKPKSNMDEYKNKNEKWKRKGIYFKFTSFNITFFFLD